MARKTRRNRDTYSKSESRALRGFGSEFASEGQHYRKERKGARPGLANRGQRKARSHALVRMKLI